MRTDPTTTATTAKTDFALDTETQSTSSFIRDYVQRVRGGEMGALPAVLGLVVLCIIFGLKSSIFLSDRNFANLITQAAPTIVIAMGVTFVLLLGEIDLSAGTTAGVAAAVLAVRLSNDWPTWAAIAACILVGFLIGTFTGLLVARVGIPSFVVTLALFLAWQGLILKIIGDLGNVPITNEFINGIENKNMPVWMGWALWVVGVGAYAAVSFVKALRRRAKGITAEPLGIVAMKVAAVGVVGGIATYLLNQNRANEGAPKALEGVPYIVPILLALFLVLTFVLGRTPWGRHIYAVGGNAEAARRAGINVPRIKLSAFMVCSSLAALGGIVLASRLNSVDPQTGGGNTLLLAVAAAVIGGTSLFGGKGKIRNAIIGGFVVAVIDNGLGLLDFKASDNFIITGFVLLLAASVDALSRRRQMATGR